MDISAVKYKQNALTISWVDGSCSDFPLIWLRDNDPGELHPDTQERIFDLTTVELDIRPLEHRLENSSLLLQWPGRNDISHYPTAWLYASRPGTSRRDAAGVERHLWDAETGQSPPRFNALQCAKSESGLWKALKEAKRTGLVIIEGLDDDQYAGERFGEQIGFKRQSNFGIMFDVINTPSPNNLAYTSLALPLHTDLPNQEIIPGYQFLHCLRNSVNGGASLFADGYKICADLRSEQPDHFALLAEIEIPWRFHDSKDDIRSRRPIINLDSNGEVRTFAFNAHIADIPDLSVEQLPEFYAAYRNLMLRIRNPRYRVSYALQPGEMVMFDNRRVLHGREAFDPASGERHYRGFYIEHNEVDSRIRILAR